MDLRGHGAHIARGPIDTETWCDDPVALLDAERVARAVVVGHSRGAQVALQMAARHSARVAGLMLIDPVFRAALHGRAWRIAQTSPLLRLAAAVTRAVNALGLRCPRHHAFHRVKELALTGLLRRQVHAKAELLRGGAASGGHIFIACKSCACFAGFPWTLAPRCLPGRQHCGRWRRTGAVMNSYP